MSAIYEKKKSYTIQSLGVEDTEEVIDFDAPCNRALGITENPIQDNWITNGIGDGCSFKALNEAGEIVAIKVNAFMHRGDEFDIEFDDDYKTVTLLQMAKYVSSQFDVFSLVEPNIDRIVEGLVTAIRSDYRRQGIANALYKKTVDWLKENDIKYMITMCSSYYTTLALACQRMGFKEVFSINFVDYQVNGVRPIVPEWPHTCLKKFLTTVV